MDFSFINKRFAARLISFLMGFAILLMVSGNVAQAAKKDVVKSLSVNSALTISEGSSKTVTAKVGLSKKASSKSALYVTAKSNKPKVAKVSVIKKPSKKAKTGNSSLKITGVKTGTAIITVTTKSVKKNGKKYTKKIKVTVEKKTETDKNTDENKPDENNPEDNTVNITSVEFDRSHYKIEKGNSVQTAISLLPTNADKNGLFYVSQDPEIASIDTNGMVTALKPGTTEVKACIGGLEAKAFVYVSSPSTRTMAQLYHKEVDRAVELGLVTDEYMQKPTQSVTVREVVDLYAKLLGRFDKNKVSMWENFAVPSDDLAIGADAVIADYYMASYLAKNGIPVVNGTPCHDEFDMQVFGKNSPWSFENIWITMPTIVPNLANGASIYNLQERDNLVTHGNHWIALLYCECAHSYYSKQSLIPMDIENKSYHLEDTLSRENLALMLCRCYDSVRPEAEYITIEEAAEGCKITQDEIEKAAEVPVLDYNGVSTKWQGFTSSYRNSTPAENGGIYGGGSAHTFIDGFVESDFAFMKEHGINYCRLAYSICNLSYPDYQTDRSKVNRKMLEEFDEIIGWGLKYGVHISISFQGYPDDDLNETMKELYDSGVLDNFLTRPRIATEAQWELKKRVLSAFAARYKNIPPEYLSFELECEVAAMHCSEMPGASTWEATADNFIALANAVWGIDDDRTVSMSSDESLGEDANPDVIKFWTRIAGTGIGLDYHLYRPREFCVPVGLGVTSDELVWPFKDKNDVTWNMEKTYDEYIKPWKSLADSCNTSLRIGESGMFGYDGAEFVLTEEAALAWAEDYKNTLRKYGIPYALGGSGSSPPAVVVDYLPTTSHTVFYRPGADWKLLTIELDGYTTQVFWDETLTNALYGE